MDYTKLLLAAKIRELATELREEDRKMTLPSSAWTSTDPKIQAITNEWERHNNFDSYIRRAIIELRVIANDIDKITAAVD